MLPLIHPYIYAISSVVGSVLVISGTYILLWGKSTEEEQGAEKDAQKNQQDEECWSNFDASANVPSMLMPNGEQGFKE